VRLKDIKIGVQLRLGLGIILAFVMLSAVLCWRATHLLWLQTATFYDHPYQVRRAIGHLDGALEGISLQMRELFLAENDHDRVLSIQGIEIRKRDVDRQLSMLYTHYLGPRDDVISLENELARWDIIRDETLGMVAAGARAEARARIKSDGIQEIQREVVQSSLKKIDLFAMNKADQIYQKATEQSDAIKLQLTTITSITLLFSMVIIWLLIKGIRGPLSQLTAAAEQFRSGDTGIRSSYNSLNEFGVLNAAFNAMADMVETQIKLNGQNEQLANVMLRETEARPFCRELIKALIEHTSSQIGAIYLLNHQNREFEHFDSIGLKHGTSHISFSASLSEGEFGAALATGRMQRIVKIPEKSHFIFSTVSGELKPREIITIPISNGKETVAVISLASVRSYSDNSVRLLERVLSTMSARVNGVLVFRQVQELAEQLQHQNRELETQKQELAAQTDELTEMNVELEMQKKQLGESSRLKSVFLSTMSHELRTPLNSVIVLSGVLSRRLAGAIQEEELSYLEVIERNGKELLSLINNILDLSRIESGREEINPAHFSIQELVADLLSTIEPQALRKGISLEERISDDLPPVFSDPEKFRHILRNLVGNAVKFTEKGAVEISARQVGDEISVEISDTGIGIAADQLSIIFEEFRQADDSASRKYGGTGLGLAIAWKYATMLQGDISVISTPGSGSTFTLRLPLSIYLPEPESDSSMESEEPSGFAAIRQTPVAAKGRTILLVDDSEPAVIQMSDILAGQGYSVKVARNGHDALTQIKAAPPDAVILDLMMPDMDGFEVLKNIRSIESGTLLPVLMLTAKHVTSEELSFLKGNHIYQLIQKGDVGRAELLTSVAKMVSLSPSAGSPQGEDKCYLQEGQRQQLPQPHTSPGTSLNELSAAHDRSDLLAPKRERPLILLVEDNQDNMQTLRALLMDRFSTIEAEDGIAGVEQARLQMPDLILMDLDLPVMDGFKALTLIREDERLRTIPVVAVTASAMKGDREKILSHGFDGYISKPIDAELMMRRVNEVLDVK